MLSFPLVTWAPKWFVSAVFWLIFRTHFTSSPVMFHAELVQLECIAVVVNYEVTDFVIVSILLVGTFLFGANISLDVVLDHPHTFRTDIQYHLSLKLVTFVCRRNMWTDGHDLPVKSLLCMPWYKELWSILGTLKESCADVWKCHHTHDAVILTATNGQE
jgi:hypothetical protein